MPPAALDKEVRSISKKSESFEQACLEAGLGLREVFATAQHCLKLFLEPGGEYAWFFQRLRVAYSAGSFLFVHAGIDDALARRLDKQGVKRINRNAQKAMRRDPFGFYFGPRANAMRTKYRETNFPLTKTGVEQFHRAGFHAVVHGHRNTHTGQRLMLRHGVLHIECDTTMNCNSRSVQGLPGAGFGVTIIDPAVTITGLSSDHPRAKIFQPDNYLGHAETAHYEAEHQTVSSRLAAGP